jgi:hypothetical protein
VFKVKDRRARMNPRLVSCSRWRSRSPVNPPASNIELLWGPVESFQSE